MSWREVFKLNIFSFMIKFNFISHKNKLNKSNNKKPRRNVRK